MVLEHQDEHDSQYGAIHPIAAKIGCSARTNETAFRILPASWRAPDRIATSALGFAGWDAGTLLIQAASPSGWQRLSEAEAILRVGGEELKACREAAARTGKDQRCTITMKPPGRNSERQ